MFKIKLSNGYKGANTKWVGSFPVTREWKITTADIIKSAEHFPTIYDIQRAVVEIKPEPTYTTPEPEQDFTTYDPEPLIEEAEEVQEVEETEQPKPTTTQEYALKENTDPEPEELTWKQRHSKKRKK
jgi:hypothetical protein